MPICCTGKDRVLTMTIKGEVDHHAAREILRGLDEGVERELPRRLRLDLSAVTFMDSSGIAVVLRAYRRMQALEGKLELTGVPAQAAKVLRSAGLDRIIPFE